MNTIGIATLRTFFGWCSVINIGLLLFSTIVIIAFRRTAVRIHGTLFNLDEQALSKAYFQYLAHYKIAMIIFCVVPYVALKLMGEL